MCGKQKLCFRANFFFEHHFGSFIVVDYQPVCLHSSHSSSRSISLLPLFCPRSISLLTSVLHEYNIYSLFSPSISLPPPPFLPSLPPEVRSDTVPGRGAERREDIAVESRGDQPGPGAVVRRHLRSVRPAAIHPVLALRRRDEGPAASGPAPGPGQPQ